MAYNWYKITKHYQGGSRIFQIRIPDIKITKDDWNDLLEWIGDNTDGGHNYGYTLYKNKLREKDTKLPVVQYPNYIIAAFEKFGDKVVVTKKMI